MLELPDERQKGDHDCGEAAVACVLKFFTVPTAKKKFATLQDGADPRQLEAALRLSGLNVLAGEMSIHELKHFTKTNRPVICLIKWDTDAESHYVVVRGVEHKKVFVHDVQSGHVVVSLSKWQRMWLATGRMNEVFKRWGIVAWPKEIE